MNDIFFILLLICSFLLILGLLSPKTSLFWTRSNQTRGKSTLLYGVAAILFFVAVGETDSETEIKMTDYINIDKPLTLKVIDQKSRTFDINSKTTIEPNSETYKQIIQWLESNLTDWESTPASFLPLVSVSQDNFNLIYFKGGYVVVNLVDKEGKASQYQKRINPGELDFLLK